MNINYLKNVTVKVNSGSGCLFQPLNSEYSYVLTAQHVIEDVEKIEIIRQNLDDEGEVINESIEVIGEPFFHNNENKDAAIIKVKKVDGIELLLRDESSQNNLDNYYLSGHPKSRLNNAFSYRKNKLTIENSVQYGYIEAELSTPAIRSEIIGQSGGGIIKIDNSCFLLAGIQKKMAVPDGQETLGRIEFMPLSFFDEIVDANHDHLTTLYPPYIASFERLLNEIFPLDNLTEKKQLIQDELKIIAKGLCADFSPEKILDLYGSTFLTPNTENSIINHKKLWISFLEILTFNQLHSENSLSFEHLKDLHKKRKLFIVDSDAWTKNIEEIYKADLSEVEKGGTVVICATRENVPSKLEFSSEELPVSDISVPISEMNISNTVENPFKDLRLVNIYKFQSHIINNVLAYREATNINVKEILQNETKNII
ncbi:MAG: hypothetical protein JKY42_12145 [Flavobacteriales bacterium]|nr:hypothetical protein [Flavobacteriales bacterium]